VASYIREEDEKKGAYKENPGASFFPGDFKNTNTELSLFLLAAISVREKAWKLDPLYYGLLANPEANTLRI
jgi:hypothetical protein